MTTGFAFSDRFLDHDTGRGHPERPDRLRAITSHLQEVDLWDDVEHLSADPLSRQQAVAVHDVAYLERLEKACAEDWSYIDAPDSAICPESFEIALLAAGHVVQAARAVLKGQVSNAFCAVRPPGHHAEADRSMGFCLLNNIALAADTLVREEGLKRVAVVDFDVHHGNGTQHIFENRSDVLFISIHEDPMHLYPGSGFADETGLGPGEGFTLNIPLPPGSGDDDYLEAIDRRVLPTLSDFDPQFLLVSAGFDAAEADPLAHMRVSSDGFGAIADHLCDFAERTCDGRHVAVLEGGYDLGALASGLEHYLHAMLRAGE